MTCFPSAVRHADTRTFRCSPLDAWVRHRNGASIVVLMSGGVHLAAGARWLATTASVQRFIENR